MKTLTTWRTNETKDVYEILASPGAKTGVEQIVRVWNEEGLLGVELADELQELVTKNFERRGVNGARLARVDWNQIAEVLAEEICGVGEDELTRRFIEAGGTL